MNSSEIFWHDCIIHAITEDLGAETLTFLVNYPVNWDENLFEMREIVFRDVVDYRIDGMPCVGLPAIDVVEETKKQHGLVEYVVRTNHGVRRLFAKSVELRVPE